MKEYIERRIKHLQYFGMECFDRCMSPSFSDKHR